MISSLFKPETINRGDFFLKANRRCDKLSLVHLSMTAEERYNDFFDHHKELFNQVPLQYIASMLGMTAETFS